MYITQVVSSMSGFETEESCLGLNDPLSKDQEALAESVPAQGLGCCGLEIEIDFKFLHKGRMEAFYFGSSFCDRSEDSNQSDPHCVGRRCEPFVHVAL